ncbi:MAG: winged helix DNA-binding domain-containing protein, partial [Rhizomicrobium sp.]
WLRAQRLDEDAPFGDGPVATQAAIEHLGYVQIDTINVIERCHHHILFTRIPGYRREHLHQAQSIDKTVFEYLAHALAYLPTADMRFYTAEMREYRQRVNAGLASVGKKEVRKVLARIKREGALSLRDIDDDVPVEKDHAWASRKPSERALRLAFYSGALTISRRSGILKTYDLMERHFGWDKSPKPAPEKETLNHLLDRALRSQGIVSLDSICHLDAPRKPGIRRIIDARMRRGELVPVDFDGMGKFGHWARPETLAADPASPPDRVHILSPFDPLIIQRKRLAMFFDYNHVFEAYLPKPKRKFGYFALPVLIGDKIVAVLDLKTDRAQQKLLVQQWTWIEKGSRRARKKQIEEALHRFEHFQLAR